MRLNLNREKHEETIKILKAMSSRNKQEAETAMQAFAAFVGPAATQVLNQVATNRYIYRTTNYDLGSVPSIPVDLYFDNHEGLFNIWSNSQPGGLATNEVYGMDEWRFRPFRLDSAVSFPKNYVRDARLDVVALTIERFVQEILAKEEYQAWSVICSALGESRTEGNPHVINSHAKASSLTRNFVLDDVSRLWTLIRRMRPRWLGGSAVTTPGQGITDLFVSPETVEKIRAMAYNPQNTVAGVTGETGTEAGSTVGIALPDNMRQRIYDSAGMTEIFGVKITPLNELGVNRPYNVLFDQYYTPVGSEPTFSSSTNEVAIGFDLSLNSYVKAVAIDSESNGEFVIEADDQFVKRQDKIGYYGFVEEGFMCGDTKGTVGIIW